jgi:hypothetical protein
MKGIELRSIGDIHRYRTLDLAIIPQARMPALSLCNTALCGLRTFVQLVLSMVLSNKASHLLNNQHLDPQTRQSIKTLGSRGYQLHSNALMSLLERTRGVTFDHMPHLRPHLPPNPEIPSERFLSIPTIVKGVLGNHITHILVDKKIETIEFFDSKGLTLNHPSNLRAKEMVQTLQEKLPKFTIFEHTQQRQFDGHNCGVFVIWHLRQRLNGLSPKDIPGAVDIEAFRLSLAEELAR